MSTALMNQEERILVQRGGLSEVVVEAAKSCTKVVSENCGLCTLYCDKQVQYESVLLEQVKQYNVISPLEELFQSMDYNSNEVQATKDYLFDEQDVVKQAHSRAEDDE